MSKVMVIDVTSMDGQNLEKDGAKKIDDLNKTSESGTIHPQEDTIDCELFSAAHCDSCKKVESADTQLAKSTPSDACSEEDTTNDLKLSVDVKCTSQNEQIKRLDNMNNLQIVIEESEFVTQQCSPAKTVNNERQCRICLDNIDQGDLIAPCKCSGSTKYAHESCMLKWFFKSSKKSCEVCLGNVNVKPIGFKPFQEWRLPESGCDFIVYLFGLYFLIMVIFTGMIAWIATQGCISPVCVTLYTVCAVAVFYFFYCCGCVEYSRKYWKALLSVNKVWRIYGRADSLKNFKHQVIREVHTAISLVQAREDMQPYVIDVTSNKITTEESVNNNNNNNTNPMGVDNFAVEIDDVKSE